MSLRALALRVGELKPLQRSGLLLFGARCAMRVEPWLPTRAEPLWSRGLEQVMAAAFSEVDDAAVATLRRQVSDCGAVACNRLAPTDEPLGRCMNYATQTLARVLEATVLEAATPLKKAIMDAAKLSASIAAVLAHAGRVVAPAGADPVDAACTAMWETIRTDIPLVAGALSEVEHAQDRIGALRNRGPLWVGEVPDWVATQRTNS